MIRLRVGEPFHPGVTGFAEGTHYNYNPFGHTLTLSIQHPSESEIEEIRERRPSFALIDSGAALFVLTRFSDLTWRAAAYNWWINPPAMRPDPIYDLEALNGGISIKACLVDASTGLVEVLRAVRLSHEFGSALLRIVESQTRKAFNVWEYLEKVRETSLKSWEEQRVIADALCLCVADPELQEDFLSEISFMVQ